MSRFLSRRDLLVSSAAALAACRSPKATTFQGYCFVANQKSRSVAVVDLRRFRVRQQIALDAAPSMILAHPSAPKVYALAPDTGTVYEIAAATLAVSRRARAGNQATCMQLSPNQKALWILSNDPMALVELPLDSMKPQRRIRLSSPASGFDLTGQGGESRAAIAGRDGGIVLASLESGSVERTINAGSEPSLVRFRMDGKSLIVGSGAARSLSIFDVPTGKTMVRLPLAVEPCNLCVSSDGGQMFISGPGMDAVVIVFPYSTEIWQTVLAGRAPGAMAVTGRVLLVANPETNSITALDIVTQKLVAVVQVGSRPGQIVFTPDQQYALVLNEGSGDVAIIRTYSLQAPQLAARARFKSAPVFTMIPVGEQPVSAAVVSLV